MVTVDKAIIASLDRDGKHFEILVDADLALEIREGKPITQVYSNLLASDDVYKDSKKGEKASSSSIEDIFKTDDIQKIAEEIILNGRVELTTDQKRKQMEQKRKEIINYISKNAINPLTKAPHPPQRVELAMDQARVQIDPAKGIKQQIGSIIEKLKPIIPMSFEQDIIIVKIPFAYANQVMGVLKTYEIIDRQWGTAGVEVKIKISAGQRQDITNKIYALTNGGATVEKE